MLHILYRKEYQHAAKQLKDVLARKKREHNKIYYAARIAQSYPHVDPKRLVRMVEAISPDILPKSGAGQDGTDELAKTYIKATPGQNYKKFREYIK